MTPRCSAIAVSSEITLYHTGPSLDHGPLPSLFYFAISGPDTLCLDPFNQPVQFLKEPMMRIFSMTLPGHEHNLPATGAMKIWAEEMQKGINLIDPFLDSIQTAIHFAIREKFIDPTKLAVAGLSRGAFIAAHLAAREEKFQHLVLFAPLTSLRRIKEFTHFSHPDLPSQLDLIHLAPKLADRHIRLYIGNADTRVGTRECFDFAMALVEAKQTKRADTELLIYPSIGQMGHGTPPEIFKQGADWICKSIYLSA